MERTSTILEDIMVKDSNILYYYRHCVVGAYFLFTYDKQQPCQYNIDDSHSCIYIRTHVLVPRYTCMHSPMEEEAMYTYIVIALHLVGYGKYT